MPIHDWSRVDTGIFHDFHHAWIEEIKRFSTAGFFPQIITHWRSNTPRNLARMF